MTPRLYSLYSGSSGNAFLVDSGSTRLLIDGGKNCKHLTAALESVGVDPASVDAVLLTHEHSDHTAALPVFLKRHPVPLHVAKESIPFLCPGLVCYPNIVPHPQKDEYTVGNIRVTSFPLAHDSVACVGFRMDVETEGGVISFGYATDLGFVPPFLAETFSGCRGVVLESNHDVDMLRNGEYTYELKQRILSRHGHLSNRDCADFVSYLFEHGTKRVLLAHVSRENNTPALAFDETFSAVGSDDLFLRVASPDEVTPLPLDEP